MSDHVTTLTTYLLVRELNGVTEWQELGLILGLRYAKIQEIERAYLDTSSRRSAMLAKWMREESNPSWEMVIEALEKMFEYRLADQLRVKYCTQQVTQPASEKVIMLDRRDAIVRRMEYITQTYLKLVTAAELALENQNPSSREIKSFSRFYMVVEVDTVADLFDQLKPFYFVDYAILEKIISFFLTHDQLVVSKLNDYIQQLEEFKSSTIVQQFMESIETAQQPLTTSETPRTCTVTLRLVGGWLEKTVIDLDKLLKVLFQDKSSVLTHLRIVRGEGGVFSSKSPLMKTSAGNLMFTSNNVYDNVSLSYSNTCAYPISHLISLANSEIDYKFVHFLLICCLYNISRCSCLVPLCVM